MNDFWRMLLQGNFRSLDGSHISADAFARSDPTFAPYYREKILPKVEAFERRRVEALRRFRIRALFAIGVGTFAVCMIVFIMNGNLGYEAFLRTIFANAFSLMLVILAGVSGFYFTSVSAPIGTYKRSVKDQIYPLILEFFGKDFSYSRVSPLAISSLEPSGIIPEYSEATTEDYVRGVYKGVPLELVESELNNGPNNDNEGKTERTFKGLLIRMSAHKTFKGKTLVKRDYGPVTWANNRIQAFERFTQQIGRMDSPGIREPLERVKLEDPEFERQFEVFSTDQVEARYLPTPSFMARLQKVGGLFDAKWIQCSFYSNLLLIMIPLDKDYFEMSSVFQPATFIEDIHVILTEMKLLFDIIDTLKLNEKTGL